MDNEPVFSDSEAFDFKKFFAELTSNWYWFIITIILALITGFLVVQYTTPIYMVSSNVLVQDEQNPVQKEILELNNLSVGGGKVENELGILRSRELLTETIKSLNYDVFYYQHKRFGMREIYDNAPFEIKIIKKDNYIVNTLCNLHYISPNKAVLQTSVKKAAKYNAASENITNIQHEFNYNDTVQIGDTISGAFGTFQILPNLEYASSNMFHEEYAFQFNSLNYLRGHFNRFAFSPDNNSSIIKISLQGENPKRMVEFINTFLEIYLQKGVEKKNRVAQATIIFINNQLKQVSDSLAISEDQLEQFQSTNKLLQFDYQAQQLYGNIESLQQDKQRIELRLEYYSYLKKYIENNETPSDIVAPSSMNISEPLLSNLIMQLTELTSERKEMLYNTKKSNPYINTINRKIDDVRKTLLENLESSIQTTTLSLKQVNNQITHINTKFRELPSEQRRLLAMKRDFELNNELYNFLLKKRSEMQIAKASNLPSNEIIDRAELSVVYKTEPNPQQVYLIALVIGIMLPGGLIYLRNALNNRITDREDVTGTTDYPIIGQIFHHKYDTNNIFEDQPNSQIADSFRSIRTNFRFFEKQQGANVVQITSSLTREGKSFVSLNLAESFAANNKRTILVDFDLRKARIKVYAKLTSNKGLSNYLSGHAGLDQIIYQSKNKNLDIITGGPIPPNPTELVESEYTGKLITALRQKYDYVIIDTPPISSISDAYILTKFADINLYVVRNNYTPKKLFQTIIQDIAARGIKLHIVINDIIATNSRYYGYYKPYRYESEPKTIRQNVKDLLFSRN